MLFGMMSEMLPIVVLAAAVTPPMSLDATNEMTNSFQ
jgi:hypothetical protein